MQGFPVAHSTKSKAGSPSPSYETRLTLFIDFLGFGEHVRQTVGDRAFLAKLVKTMDRVGEIAKDDKEFYKSQQITQFSDSIVVSYHIDEKSGAFWLINEIEFCIIDLVERGFLLRGALTVGDLLHTEKHVVGPALVEAYELESKVAKFPRILVDKKIIEVARKARREGHTEAEEEEYVRSFLTEDSDRHLYLNYVAWSAVVAVAGGSNDGYPAYLEQVGKLVREGLNQDNAAVVEKYLWLHQQYEDAIERVESLPPGHAYRASNPEVCEAIESLPKLSGLAKKARLKIS